MLSAKLINFLKKYQKHIFVKKNKQTINVRVDQYD